MLAIGMLGDNASVDIYGKVVDQNGQPIIGVKVQGHVHKDLHGLDSCLGRTYTSESSLLVENLMTVPLGILGLKKPSIKLSSRLNLNALVNWASGETPKAFIT
jgi:hypothetical protein